MAWPSCALRCGDLVRVLGTVDGICGDDDPVAYNLLDDRSEWLEVEPQCHLERLIAIGRNRVVAAGWRRVEWQLTAWCIGDAVSSHAGVGDEDPAGVGGRQLRRTLRVSPVG